MKPFSSPLFIDPLSQGMSYSQRVTLSDIAERLDLTKVSVSKALRDHSDISTKTKEVVKKTAKEMGYRHNRLARSLTLKKTYTIGVVIPKLSHTFFSNVLDGINQIASDNDYEIILCVSEEDAEQEKQHVRTLLSMQVDGLLVSITQETSEGKVFREVQNQSVPLVFFDRGLDDIAATCVQVDDRGGAYQAVCHAVDHGRSRIAHLAGHSHISIGRERRRGYETALQDRGIELGDEWIEEAGFGERGGYVGGKKLLRRISNPDAIFAVTFSAALGLEDAIQELMPSARADIQIYSFGQHRMNRFFRHPHVSVFQPAETLGKQAMTELLDTMENPNREPTTRMLDTYVADPHEANGVPHADEVASLA